MSYGNEAGRSGPAGFRAPREIDDLARADILSRQARWSEAESLLARIVRDRPRDVEAGASLAHAQIAQNKPLEALRTIDALTGAGATLPAPLLLLKARLLLAASRWHEAAEAFRRVIEAAPRDGAADLGLAVALGKSGLDRHAAEAALSAIGKGHDTAAARYLRGHALYALQRFDEAEAELRRALRADPRHAAAHASLVDLLWMRTGDVEVSSAALDAALRSAVSSELIVLKSRLLAAAGQGARACETIEAGLRELGDRLDLHTAAAEIAIKREDPAGALRHAERAQLVAPGDTGALGILADALLATGDAERAVAIAERLLAIDRDDGHALALRAACWRRLGDPRYDAMYDYARFVRARPLDTPSGWRDLDAYLADLARELHDRHEAMHAHPLRQTLVGGTQVELRLPCETPAIDAFAQAIDGPIRRYLDEIGRDGVLAERNTGAYALREIWSVRLRRGGHHTNHFHGRGWISSACYIELPPASGGAGWLKLGETCLPTRPPLGPEYFVRPEPGLLVLFPSWMWHGTTPFAGDAHRLTIAFDLVPG